MSIEAPLRKDVLSVLDPELPFLASEAAIDIENLLTAKAKDLAAVRRLATRLRNSIPSASDGGPRSLMDPATLTVLGEAIYQSLRRPAPCELSDLLGQAQK